MKVAIIEVPTNEDAEYDSELICWDASSIPEWKEITKKEYELLCEYLLTCKSHIANQYKSTKNSPFKGMRYHLVVLHDPEIIDFSLERAKELAKEYEVEKVEHEKKLAVSKKKREAKALATKRNKLAKLKQELGEA